MDRDSFCHMCGKITNKLIAVTYITGGSMLVSSSAKDTNMDLLCTPFVMITKTHFTKKVRGALMRFKYEILSWLGSKDA